MGVVASTLLLLAATQVPPPYSPAQAAPEPAQHQEEAIRRYTWGRLLEERGQPMEALNEFYRTLIIDAGAPVVARRISSVAAQLGESEQSLEFADRSLTLEPDNAQGLWLKGSALFSLGRPVEALKSLEAATRVDSEQVEYQLSLARVAEQLDRVDVVADAYARAVELDEDNGESWFQLAAARARLHEFSSAEKALDRAVELNPLRPGLFFLMGWIQEGLGQSARAIGLYRRHLGIHDADQVTRRRLVNLLARKGKFSEAYKEVQPLAREHPNDLDVMEVEADLAHRSNHRAEANRILERMRRSADRDPDQMGKVVGLMIRQGRAKEAITLADDWQAHHAGDVRGMMLAARARALADQPDSAISHARHTVEMVPDSLAPRVLLAQLYQGRKRFQEAEGVLKETARRFPSETGVALDLAFCREQLGDLPGAQAAARDVLRSDPDNPTALNFLGYLLADHDLSLEEALAMIRRALEHDPDNGAYVDSLGWAYYRLGRLVDARRELERAVDLTGGDPVVREHLGDVYKDLRLMELARDQYRKSLAGDTSNIRVRAKLSGLR